MYAYNWVYTSAQLELLACDTPIVVYDKDKDGEVRHTKKEMDDLLKRWNEKKKRQEEAGEKFDFKDFINKPLQQFGSKQY